MDVLNGFILDGIIDNYKKADLNFVEDHINNCKKLININKTIFIFNRGYVSLSLYATLLSNKTYFVSRLAKNSYIHEQKYLKSDDETIIINANSNRLNKFKNISLKKRIQ